MTADHIMTAIFDAGLTIRSDGGNLKIGGNIAGLSDELKVQITEHKPDLLRLLAANEPEPTYSGFSVADLENASHPDEWIQICDNSEALECFALSLLEDRQIQAGIRPERFTAVAHCAGCGVVWLPPTWFVVGRHETLDIPKAHGCRWCGNRLAGLPRAKPYPLPHNGYDVREHGRWPYSEACRPLSWQGTDERKRNGG